jgi:hypothetical protein
MIGTIERMIFIRPRANASIFETVTYRNRNMVDKVPNAVVKPTPR